MLLIVLPTVAGRCRTGPPGGFEPPDSDMVIVSRCVLRPERTGVAFWGTVMAGGIAVAVNTRSARPEVEFILTDAGVRVDLTADAALPEGEPYVEEGLGADDVAALFYTSGTTGHPKGVPTTHKAFLTNAENMIRCLGAPYDVGAELRTLICVPLFH